MHKHDRRMQHIMWSYVKGQNTKLGETLEWTGLIPRPGVKLGSLGMGLGVRCAGVLLSLASHWVRSVLHTYTVHQGYSILNIQCYGIITHAVAWWTVCMWTQMLVVNTTYMGVAAKTVPKQQSWVAYSMNSNCKTYNYRCSCVDKLQAITHVLRLKYAVWGWVRPYILEYEYLGSDCQVHFFHPGWCFCQTCWYCGWPDSYS